MMKTDTHTPHKHTHANAPPRPHARTATDPHTNRILFFANVLKLNLLQFFDNREVLVSF